MKALKYYININRHLVAKNRKNGMNEPVIRVSKGRYGRPTYARKVKLLGPSRVVYSTNSTLPCGARAWIETEADIKIG